MEVISNFHADINQYQDVGLFLMRLLIGWLFVYSGYGKAKKIKAFAKHNGLPLPIAQLVVLAELTGGIGLIFGLLTQIAALFIMIVMTGSIYMHIFKWKSPYWASKGGWEYDLMWFTMCLVILVTGGGSIAVYPAW